MAQANPGTNEEGSFLETQRYLQGLDLPVPRVLGRNAAEGLVFLEDLGDGLLETVVGKSSPDQTAALYHDAVDILLRMRGATGKSPGGCAGFYLAFDEEKLMQEMRFFMDHFIRDFSRIELSASAARTLEAFFLKICRILAAEPRILTHRDYHSRNLIFHQGRLFMIDFQDARMGPCQYDLASLLRDSYVSLPDKLIDEILEGYAIETGHVTESDCARFRYIFDIMSLQRNIKALGTFGYQAAVRGSSRYLSSIPRTGAYVARTVARYEEFAEYRAAIEDFICSPSLLAKAK
jgi:aminoglycoside/choline kinase family phosphotransferase